jgi:pimeloyl-ACP methyl ester carboxylesterase
MKLEKTGDPKKPAAVFLHGYGAPPKLYQDFIDRLADTHHVYVPEIFGMNGLCRRDFFGNLDAIYAMMRGHGLEQSLVVGHSYGALAAMHVAAEFPRLTRAVAVNPLLPEIFTPDKFRLQLGNMQRDLKYATGELRGMLANPGVGIAYGMNVIANPLGYIEGAARAVASALPQKRSDVPVEIVYADLDTLFHIEDSDLGKWRTVLPQLKFTPVTDYSHNWLIYHGSYAYETMKGML